MKLLISIYGNNYKYLYSIYVHFFKKESYIEQQ